MAIYIKNFAEQNKMREAGKILSLILSKLLLEIKPDINTQMIDSLAYDLILSQNVKPAFLGYYGFPASICTSINEEIVHGIPSKNRYLREKDILSVDIGIIYDGYCADMAVTVPIGEISQEDKNLIEITKASLIQGIKFCKPGNKLGDVGFAIQQTVENANFSVVREYVGHGIGKNMHEEPQILNYGTPNTGIEIKEGMVFAIEPMVNVGTWKTKLLKDKWTVVTKDNKKSAHFEHTVLITKDGNEILTEI
jgi:methionyl aminopeptidase